MMRPPYGNVGAPIYLNFMIAIHCNGDTAEQMLGRKHWNSPGGKEVRQWLSEEGLAYHKRTWIEDNGDVHMCFESTERGRAWVDHACRTPLPVIETKWNRGTERLGRS